LMFSAPRYARHSMTFTGCRLTAFDMPPDRPKFVPDAIMAHLKIVITGLDPKVEVEPYLTVYIGLEDWSDVDDVLSETRAEVAEIMNAPQILRAL
jgi:hypothetical protein